MYLIDSDILIDLGRGKAAIQQQMNRVGLSQCVLSEISLAELYVGVYKRKNKRQEALMHFFENTFTAIPITSALQTYARIRAQLDLQGVRLDSFDLLIGATALANGYTLVTHNSRHFSRIPGLKIVDWPVD